MRRGAFIWGLILIVVGGLLLADQFGFLPANWWQVLWPALIILVGLRMIVGGVTRGPAEERLSVPLADAPAARIVLRHGAGRLAIADGASPGSLIEGEFAGGISHVERRATDQLTVELRTPDDAWRDLPWGSGRGLDWNVRLSGAVPLAIDLEGGANESRLDLTRLPVRELRLQTGASSTYVMLPATAGFTHAWIRSGAASVRLAVPPGVGARMVGRAGLGSLDIAGRFIRSGDEWRSADYETAANKIDLDLEVGVGSIRVE